MTTSKVNYFWCGHLYYSLEVNWEMKAYIGLDIGGTKILGALFDEYGKIIKRVKKKTKAAKGTETVLLQIFKVIDGLLEDEEIHLLGIGAGCPGFVKDYSTVVFSPNIPFVDYDLAAIIKAKYNVPFVLGNDVNVAMFGEWNSSGFSDVNDVISIFVGTGVGGGIIIDGKIYVGQGGAGEIGHMIVNPNGIICGCGSHGCLEAYASKTGIQKSIVAGIRKGRKTVLKEYLEADGDVIKSSSLRRAYEANDEFAVEVIDGVAFYLGIGISNLVNIFHPEMVILGGGVMESLGEELLPIVIKESKKYVMPGMMNNVKFQLSKLSDDAGIVGGYYLAKAIECKS